MKYMMLSEMMKGNGSGAIGSGMNNLMPLMLLSGGGFGEMFNDMFEFDDAFDLDEEEEEKDKEN